MISKVETGIAASGSARLYFEVAGAGDPLVFIHAGVSDRRIWDSQFEFFAQRFRVLRYDHRGYGKSETGAGPWMLHQDLDTVLGAAGIARAGLVGCSMGGTTAIDFTLSFPNRVTVLAVIGSGLSGWQWSPDIVQHVGAMVALARDGDSDGARRLDARLWIDGPRRDPSAVDPAYRAAAHQIHAENFNLQRMLNPWQGLTPPAVSRLSEIRSPTLITVSDGDVADLHRIAEKLAQEIVGSRLVTFPNAAHLPSIEHPDKFNRILLDFLSSTYTTSR